MFPVIKRRLASFLLSEEGRISKQSLLVLGAYVSAAVIGGVLATKSAAAAHTNSISVSYGGGLAVGSHAHHESGTGLTTGTGETGGGEGTGTTGTTGCGTTCGGCSI